MRDFLKARLGRIIVGVLLREVENKDHKPDKIEKKVTVKKRVDDGIPIGILAYSDNEPFAWCSIALGLDSNCFNSTILL